MQRIFTFDKRSPLTQRDEARVHGCVGAPDGAVGGGRGWGLMGGWMDV